MRVREIQVPASRVRGVGPATAKLLANLGILTVGDLLSWWPREWDDRTVRTFFSAWSESAKINVLAKVIAHEWFGYGRMKTLKLVVEDAEGTEAELVCFNRPFLERLYPPETEIAVNGRFQPKYGRLQSSAFDIEAAEDAPAKVLPVYSLTAGIAQTQMRKIIAAALEEYGRGIDSELPEKVRKSEGLPEKAAILRTMHAPASMQEAEAARDALIFEELFFFQYAVGKGSLKRRGRLPAVDSGSAETGSEDGKPNSGEAAVAREEAPLSPLQKHLLERIPFSLTPDQRSVADEINRDLDSGLTMARLLQGDVGSGKTLIAFLACLRVIDSGGQCAFLAPTELLARQHAENAARLLESTGVRIAFLTGNVKAEGRTNVLSRLASGEIDLVIGTHALFSESVKYRNLALAVVDEQHRFGVLQRSAILAKGPGAAAGKETHLIMMSATPIPRTLALSVFGDLDVSVIKTMPPGRKPIVTHLARQGNEQKVYDFVRRELSLGHQAYFVYPLIDQNDALDLKSAERMHERLSREVFPEYGAELIHSRIPEDEQRRIMESFRLGKTGILVATSLVEVGVDVANATCMVIEHAERFGLSALHQLRGRVGRGDLQSWCFLVYSGNLTEEGKARMKIMHETTDGFRIAEEDLVIRGPGEIAGIKQSGYAGFDLADPVRDMKILEKARAAAFALLLEENRVS